MNQYLYDAQGNAIGYDGRGNLTSIAGGEGNTYVYDALNRLTKVIPTNHSMPEVVYTYDSQNRRASKSVFYWNFAQSGATWSTDPESITEYVYDGSELVAEVDGFTGGLEKSYTWDPTREGGVGGLLSVSTYAWSSYGYSYWTGTYLPVANSHGDIVSLIDQGTGAVVETYTYSAYGVRTAGNPAMDVCPFGWDGYYFNQETCTYTTISAIEWFPTLGTFSGRDPSGEVNSESGEARFHGDPVNRQDIDGEQDLPILTREQADGGYLWAIGGGRQAPEPPKALLAPYSPSGMAWLTAYLSALGPAVLQNNDAVGNKMAHAIGQIYFTANDAGNSMIEWGAVAINSVSGSRLAWDVNYDSDAFKAYQAHPDAGAYYNELAKNAATLGTKTYVEATIAYSRGQISADEFQSQMAGNATNVLVFAPAAELGSSPLAPELPRLLANPLVTVTRAKPTQTVVSIPIPGDIDFIGPIRGGSWRLMPNGEGAHLVERVNLIGRPALSLLDTADTPRFYPDGTPEAAGQAHLRLHEVTRSGGITLRSGVLGNFSDAELLEAYENAYNDPSIAGLRGDLRTVSGQVIARGVTPAQAYIALMKWFREKSKK